MKLLVFKDTLKVHHIWLKNWDLTTFTAQLSRKYPSFYANIRQSIRNKTIDFYDAF